MRAIEIVRAGVLTTVQDLGRTGYAHIGVPRAGAADRTALRLANRLVGNPEASAGLEITLGGCALRARQALTVAVTGASCPVLVGGRAADRAVPLAVRAGEVVEIRRASTGLRAYLAVDGGFAVTPVLGSRSTDTLAGLGPPPVRDRDVLPVGPTIGPPSGVDFAVGGSAGAELTLRVWLGPRQDWFTAEALATFGTAPYSVSTMSNRVGVRLDGPALSRAIDTELPSEGVVLGAIQVPANGQPLIFLADHPATGGYPVIGVVEPADLDGVGQARPGTSVRFSILG